VLGLIGGLAGSPIKSGQYLRASITNNTFKIVLAPYPSILDYTINAVLTLTVGGNWEQMGCFPARLSLEVFPTRKGQVDSFCPSDQFRWSSPPTTMNRDRFLSLPIQLATVPNRASFPSATSATSRRPFCLPSPYCSRISIHCLPALCFHGLTNCFSRNPFPFDDNPNCPLGVGVLCSSSLPQFDGFPVTPFTATHSRNAPVTSFPAAHAKLPFCKSFRCHTSEKVGGGDYG